MSAGNIIELQEVTNVCDKILLQVVYVASLKKRIVNKINDLN